MLNNSMSILLIMLTCVSVNMLIQKSTGISAMTVIAADMEIHRYILSEIIHTTLQIKLLILTVCSISFGNN